MMLVFAGISKDTDTHSHAEFEREGKKNRSLVHSNLERPVQSAHGVSAAAAVAGSNNQARGPRIEGSLNG